MILFRADQAGTYRINVLPDDESGGEYVLSTRFVAADSVAGRFVFYSDSSFDGNGYAASSADDVAIAIDKTALLPGHTATRANYTNYSKGVNGIAVDLPNLGGTPAADDFEFRVGNDDQPSTWAAGPAPASIRVRPGEGIGQSDRVTLVWGDNLIAGQWLQVTVKANNTTGLSQPDVFYFGNAIGESGDSSANAHVNATDEIGARNHSRSFVNLAAADDPFDYNRDGKVNATDVIIARNNGTAFPDQLRLISVPDAAIAFQAVGPVGRPPAPLTLPRELDADAGVGVPVAGDANQDGRFDQDDLVAVLRQGKYLSERFATWNQGDWNGDERFDQADIVFALRSANYRDDQTAALRPVADIVADDSTARTSATSTQPTIAAVDVAFADRE